MRGERPGETGRGIGVSAYRRVGDREKNGSADRFALRSEIVIVLELVLVLDSSSLLLKSDCCEITGNGAQRFAKPKGRPPGKTEDEGELEEEDDYLWETKGSVNNS